MVIGFDAKRAFHNTSGLGNYSRDIIKILSDQFPQYQYLLYNPKPGKDKWIGKRSNIEIKFPDKWIWRKLFAVWRQGPVSSQIKRDGVDLYHGLSNEIPRGIDPKACKVVVTIHDLIFIRFPELFKPVDRWIYAKKFRFAAEHADLVIAISHQTRRDIIQYFGIAEEKIVVHYQGCHAAFKQPYTQQDKDAVKKKFDLPDRFILNVGTIEKRKNTLTILQAVRDVEIDVVVVGKATSYKTELIQYINDNGMQGRVHFLHGVDMKDLAVLYRLASLFCYPSIFEGFGIPIIEALYSGVPVITTRGGCFSEAGGPASRYVDALDIDGWKHEIMTVLASQAIANEMIQAGLEYVQKFNDDRVGRQLMAIYKKLLAKT